MTNPTGALQYGTTDGYGPFKEMVEKRVRKVNSLGEGDKIIVTTGAQQGIDLTIKILVNDGENVVVEAPTFVGTLNAMRSYRANLIGVPMEDDGMDMDKLEEVLKNNKVKLIYTIPTFQNPSGITMSLAKRKGFWSWLKNMTRSFWRIIPTVICGLQARMYRPLNLWIRMGVLYMWDRFPRYYLQACV